MSNIIISQQQLLSIQGKILEENKIQLNESEWYNTVGDILGLIDPTPTVDFINGLSYISQGDYLFGLLSLISAVPYFGDAVAKPVTGALKIGGAATKEIEIALKAAKAGDFIKSFDSIKGAAIELKISASCISGNLANKQKTVKKHTFKYIL